MAVLLAGEFYPTHRKPRWTFFLQCSSLEKIRSLYEHLSPWIVGSLEHHACMLASLLHVSREPERAISVLQEALESLKTARPASRERVGSMLNYLRSCS